MQNELILTIFKPGWHIPNLSPFCMKLETYLRMANINYKIHYSFRPQKGPTKKIPYIEHNNKIIGDSGLIIDYLKESFTDNLDTNLDDYQKAQIIAINRLCEEHLYWIVVYSRWVDPNDWPYFKKMFTQKNLLAHLFLPSIKRQIKNQLFQQGIGRLSQKDIYHLAKQDIEALSVLLGKKNFMLGDEPCSLDACCYAFVGAIWFTPWESELKKILCEYQNLLDYYARMISRYFPELPTSPQTDG